MNTATDWFHETVIFSMLLLTNTLKEKPHLKAFQQWLNTWKPVLLQSIQGTWTGTNQMHDIRHFFQPLPN